MATPKEMASVLIGIGERQYFESLGRFISAFSQTEVNLQTVLWHFAGVSSPIAPAVFSGVRADQAMSRINRVADARRWKQSRKDKLECVFTQLGHIKKLRNDIMHYGATPSSFSFTDWTVTNRLFAHVEERIRIIPISAGILDSAIHDLQKITLSSDLHGVGPEDA